MIKYSEKDDNCENYENKMFELKQNTLNLTELKEES